MNHILIPLLVAIANATSADEYLSAQDKALPVARAHYEELLVEATSNPRVGLRIEALELVELLSPPDVESVLLKSMKEEADPAVAAHAKSLLFRATVSRNARTMEKMPDAQYRTFREAYRRNMAEQLFDDSDAAH